MQDIQDIVVDYIDIRVGGCTIVAHKSFMPPLNRQLKRMVIVKQYANRYQDDRVYITVVPKFGITVKVLLHRLTVRFKPQMRAAHAYITSSHAGDAVVGIRFTLSQTSTTLITDRCARFVAACMADNLTTVIRHTESCSFIATVDQKVMPDNTATLDALAKRIKIACQSAGIFIANVVSCPASQAPTTTLLKEMRKPLT